MPANWVPKRHQVKQDKTQRLGGCPAFRDLGCPAEWCAANQGEWCGKCQHRKK